MNAKYYRKIDDAHTPDFMLEEESGKWACGRIKAMKFPMNHSVFSASFILLGSRSSVAGL